MIVVTGAAGFIGSCLIAYLNQKGFNNIVAVDAFGIEEKAGNLQGKRIYREVDRRVFIDWLGQEANQVEFIFHIGAVTDTTRSDKAIFDDLNLNYSKAIWQACAAHQIPLVYASSAATYGMGEHGYDDTHEVIDKLHPMNPYGVSKNEFDKWAIQQPEQPWFWAGLKFFNVYGPNEYHKGRMASVIFHAYNQIKATGGMKLFRSHNPSYANGHQQRDFIYVKDLVQVCHFFMHHRKDSGIYNLGTGKARTFLDLTKATFKAMQVAEHITFIDTPADIRDNYQYYTQANMAKLAAIGYHEPFTELEDGVHEYVTQYLSKNDYF